MKLKNLFLSTACLLALFSTVARAEDIAAFTDSLQSTDATQQGRLSRNGAQSSWFSTEATPLTINATTTYNYRIYKYAAALFTGAPYIEVSIYDENSAGTFFASTYAGSFDPTNLQANFIGDEGSSSNYFPGDPHFFDVILPAGQDFILVVNTTALTSANPNGFNQPYDVTIQAFADNAYNDPAPTPEPSSFITLGTGLIAAAGIARRRFRSVA